MSDSTTFTITVLDLPLAFDQSLTTDAEQAVDFSLFASAANAPISYTLSQPSHGSLSGNAPDLTYTPEPDFSGSDSFTFTVSDGFVTSAAATVSITVNPVKPVNQPPSTVGQMLTSEEDTPISITLTAHG